MESLDEIQKEDEKVCFKGNLIGVAVKELQPKELVRQVNKEETNISM